MTTRAFQNSRDGAAGRLWRQMQRAEFCRHQADIAERQGAQRADAFAAEAAQLANRWRALALAIEQDERVEFPAWAKGALGN